MGVLKNLSSKRTFLNKDGFAELKSFDIFFIEVEKAVLLLLLFFFKLIDRVIGPPRLERSRTSKDPHNGQAECEVGALSNRKRINLEGSNSGSNFDASSLPTYDSKRSNLELRSTCAQTFWVLNFIRKKGTLFKITEIVTGKDILMAQITLLKAKTFSWLKNYYETLFVEKTFSKDVSSWKFRVLKRRPAKP